MSKIPKRISASEILEILNKQWLDTKDIKKIASVSAIKAKQIKNEIIEISKKENIFLPNGLVPNEKVVSYMNLNIKYIKKIADMEGKKI